MNIFGLPASCPDCGGELKLINGTSSGSLAVAILACRACPLEWEVTARINRMRSTEQEINRRRREKSRAKAKAAAA